MVIRFGALIDSRRNTLWKMNNQTIQELIVLKGYGNIFLFGLSIRTFGVIAISVNFFVACSVSEILKDKRH